MSAYTQLYYHIVFSTKERKPVLDAPNRRRFFQYAWGFLKKKSCHLYRIGGVEDHVHILTHIHQTIALADLVRDLKTSTNQWIRSEDVFPFFDGWQISYAAFTKSHADKDKLIDYIKNQEEHHRKVTFIEELRALLEAEGIPFEERYLE
ncbi:IS200/IS605 family transposase [bacterium]|nr:IS200/IS605 family transposase [bacterium]